MSNIWTDAIIYDEVTESKHRVIERYTLPGKDTGSVLACEGRQLYWQWRDFVEWLSELPSSIHYEDRKGVVKFAVRIQQELFNEQFEDIELSSEEYRTWAKRAARRLDNDERGECEGK